MNPRSGRRGLIQFIRMRIENHEIILQNSKKDWGVILSNR